MKTRTIWKNGEAQATVIEFTLSGNAGDEQLNLVGLGISRMLDEMYSEKNKTGIYIAGIAAAGYARACMELGFIDKESLEETKK